MPLQVKKLHQEARFPTRACEGDAGLDLYAIEDRVVTPGQRVVIGTGIALGIPYGAVGLIWDKSGIASKSGMKVMGGVIDAGYRGEIRVVLTNLGENAYLVHIGDKIAQILIQKVELLSVEEVDELPDTERDEQGFGSTGIC